MRVTRRRLLAGAAGALLLGGPAGAAGNRRRVVVVGAGLAGLACAHELERRGFKVAVLEARDRVGGRVLTVREPLGDGLHAELGGELVAPSDTLLAAYARRFGLRLEPADIAPSMVDRLGRTRPYSEFVTPQVRADLERFRARVEALPLSKALDRRPAAAFVRELRLRDRARFLVEHELRTLFHVEPASLSLLFLAQQAKGRRRAVLRLAGGAARLPERLAAGLADVRLEVPVTALEQGRAGITAYAGVERWSADWCVLALPVLALASIETAPALPAPLASAVEELRYGRAVRLALEYGAPLFRGGQPSGNVLSDLTYRRAWAAGSPGVLSVLTGGTDAIVMGAVRPDNRPRLAADELADAVPRSRGALRAGTSAAWHLDRWSLGSRVAYAPGQVTRFQQALARRTGRVWLAGEHTDRLAGTMEGALRSGLRAATEIAAASR